MHDKNYKNIVKKENIDGIIVFTHESIPSTMISAEEYLSFFNTELAVIANSQSHGIGRNTKQWTSPAGNIHISIAKKLPKNHPTTQVPFISAIASAEFIKKHSNLSITYKWPNDIMSIEFKKISGILTKITQNFVIVGIGINLKTAPHESSASMNYTKNNINDLHKDIINIFNTQYHKWINDGFQEFKREWEKHAFGIGKDVMINSNNKPIGKFKGIDDNGAMLLEHNNKIIKILDAINILFI